MIGTKATIQGNQKWALIWKTPHHPTDRQRFWPRAEKRCFPPALAWASPALSARRTFSRWLRTRTRLSIKSSASTGAGKASSGRLRSTALGTRSHWPLRQPLCFRQSAGEFFRRLLMAGAVRLGPDLSAGRAGLSVSGEAYAGNGVRHAHGSFLGAGRGGARLHDVGHGRLQRGITVTTMLIFCASRSSVAFTVSPGARVLR